MPIRKSIDRDMAAPSRDSNNDDAFADVLRGMKNTRSAFAAKAERRLEPIDPDSCKIT
jgi:hypothetical protein